MTDLKTPPETLRTGSADSNQHSRPRLCFDWRDWLEYLEDAYGTETEKRQMIETLWSIILAFADAGWEVGSEPTEKTCGQDLDLTAALRAAVLNSRDPTPDEKEVV